MITEPTIEQARPEDAEAICDIRDRAWLATYPNAQLGITKEDVVLMAQGPDQIFLKNRIAYLKSELAKKDRGNEITFVAKVADKVVGYVDPFTDEQGHKWLGAIYVDPDMHGQGIGGKLMRRALEWYGPGNDIYLNVVSY